MKKQKLSEKKKDLIIKKLHTLTRLLNEREINLMHIIMQNEEDVSKTIKLCKSKKISASDLVYKWKLVDNKPIFNETEDFSSFMYFTLSGKINFSEEFSLQEIRFDFCHDEDGKICVFFETEFNTWFSKNALEFYNLENISLNEFIKELNKLISFQEKLVNFLKS